MLRDLWRKIDDHIADLPAEERRDYTEEAFARVPTDALPPVSMPRLRGGAGGSPRKGRDYPVTSKKGVRGFESARRIH
jgi:hypothetical protein